MTPRRNDPRFGPDDPSTPPEPDREAAGDPGRAGADPGDDEDDPQRADHEILTRAPEHKVQPTLQRVRDVLEMMGDPQRSYRAIHITGTNGKTSTSRMVEALLRERGLRTGRFTSPHLESVRERICIDGRAISREGFIAAWEEVEPFIDLVDADSQASGGPRLSFFEVFTVMAYAAFSDAPVDVAIVEVGMGGVWDATNVLDADVAVIGPVALDHERWLGSTLQDIASEKLGIVKPGCTVVCAAQPVAVAEMVRERAAELGARLVESGPDLRVVSRETAVGGQLVTVRTPAARYEDVPLSLRGAFQADNAAVALAAVEAAWRPSAPRRPSSSTPHTIPTAPRPWPTPSSNTIRAGSSASWR